MKFVALVSGGKDSCMNILYAQKQGHELVACANLRPNPTRPEEIDSFMFQTVGSKAVHHLAQCLDVPLYTQDLDEDNENHEIDDLVKVLQQVLEHHPDVQAVSVGAIGSVYQQVRVDSACQKLQLIPLAYLWQRDQTQLLEDIIHSGMESRMIKVAGYGLNDSHLGKTLAELQPTLLNLEQKWGLYPCGEGGEFETMVFDGPQFRKRMVMENPRVVKHSNGDVFYLTFDTRVEEKSSNSLNSLDSLASLQEPPMWDGIWDELEMLPQVAWKPLDEYKLAPRNTFSGTFSGSFDSVFDQLQLFYQTVPVKETVHVCVLLRDIAEFGALNARYNNLFDFVGPPSRKCIAVDIPDQLQITVYGGELDWETKTLHVQGRSYWAPANIGPYSQSRLYFGTNYMAGQIGLLPTTLELGPNQPKLSLQNALRIINAVHGPDNWKPIYGIVYIVDASMRPIVEDLWPFNIPLIVAQVAALPRNAECEWDIMTIDLRYVNGHPPEDDELEELYNYTPTYVKTEMGYQCYYGSQLLSIDAKHDASSAQTDASSAQNCLEVLGAPIPVKALYFNKSKVNNMTIGFAS